MKRKGYAKKDFVVEELVGLHEYLNERFEEIDHRLKVLEGFARAKMPDEVHLAGQTYVKKEKS